VKQSSTIEASIEHTSIGRVVVPPNVPEGFRLFYTTIDFDGWITDELRAFVGVPLASCHQVHGAVVSNGGQPTPAVHHQDRRGRLSSTGHEPECDALWTDEKNLALAIKVADCLPVTLIDTRGVIANIHSGWRGAVQNITAATVDSAPLDPARTTAWLGPSIRVCCFEVGEEVASQFEERFVDRTLGSKPHVDIASFTADVLGNRGIERIVDTGLCTRCEGSIFHSYRRDKRGGRNLAIVAQ
jgi:YfiH family protein